MDAPDVPVPLLLAPAALLIVVVVGLVGGGSQPDGGDHACHLRGHRDAPGHAGTHRVRHGRRSGRSLVRLRRPRITLRGSSAPMAPATTRCSRSLTSRRACRTGRPTGRVSFSSVATDRRRSLDHGRRRDGRRALTPRGTVRRRLPVHQGAGLLAGRPLDRVRPHHRGRVTTGVLVARGARPGVRRGAGPRHEHGHGRVRVPDVVARRDPHRGRRAPLPSSAERERRPGGRSWRSSIGGANRARSPSRAPIWAARRTGARRETRSCSCATRGPRRNRSRSLHDPWGLTQLEPGEPTADRRRGARTATRAARVDIEADDAPLETRPGRRTAATRTAARSRRTGRAPRPRPDGSGRGRPITGRDGDRDRGSCCGRCRSGAQRQRASAARTSPARRCRTRRRS